jgi:hypothetical protein
MQNLVQQTNKRLVVSKESFLQYMNTNDLSIFWTTNRITVIKMRGIVSPDNNAMIAFFNALIKRTRI